jgi:hypothetical protein
MIQVDRYIPFLIENKLTQPQFLLLYCIYREKWEIIAKYKEAFPTDDGSMIGKFPLQDLVDRGFIIRLDDGKTVDSFEITTKFAKIFVDEFEAGNQFWDLYPAFVVTEGKRLPLSTMDKNLFRKIYSDRINHDFEEHTEVMKDLQYAVDEGLINMGIEKFVRSEMWSKIRQMRIAHKDDDIAIRETNL